MTHEWISAEGIIQRLIFATDRTDLFSTIVEQLHSPTGTKNSHLIHKFFFEGKQYFLIGKQNYITEHDAINRVLKISPPKKVDSHIVDIAYHGVGFKLILFKVLAEKTHFFTHDYIYDLGDIPFECEQIRNLSPDLTAEESKHKFIHSYSPRRARKIDILNNDAFKETVVGKMIQNREFQTFILFESPNKVKNPELSDENNEEWEQLKLRLSKLFSINIERGDIEIYMGNDINTRPEKLEHLEELCLTPNYWCHDFTVDVQLNQEEKKGVTNFWENKATWVCRENPDKNVYFKFQSNISGKNITSTRFKIPQAPDPAFKPHIRITVARVNDEYLQNGKKEELGGGAYVLYGGYLLNPTPFRINSQIFRNLPKGSNYRIICEVLDENIINIKKAGIELAPIKIDSQIINGSNIHKSIEDIVKLSMKWFKYLDEDDRLDNEEGVYRDSDKDFLSSILDYEAKCVKNTEKSIQGSKLGCKIEQMIGDLCTKTLTGCNGYNASWAHGDAIISSRYELENQGIDSICSLQDGQENGIGFMAIQIKNKSNISEEDIDKFYKTCKEFIEKEEPYKFVKLLIVKGNKTITPIKYNEYMKKGIIILSYPSMETTDESVQKIVNDISEVMINVF